MPLPSKILSLLVIRKEDPPCRQSDRHIDRIGLSMFHARAYSPSNIPGSITLVKISVKLPESLRVLAVWLHGDRAVVAAHAVANESRLIIIISGVAKRPVLLYLYPTRRGLVGINILLLKEKYTK